MRDIFISNVRHLHTYIVFSNSCYILQYHHIVSDSEKYPRRLYFLRSRNTVINELNTVKMLILIQYESI